MKCLEKCKEYNISCHVKYCRLWIEYDSGYNCTLEAIERWVDMEKRPLTLQEVGRRLRLSLVRIKQIETSAMAKVASMLE